tara:strand:- start:522 stop:1124 length:603 start_codon:yes stop_codon:yes gene_type:complete
MLIPLFAKPLYVDKISFDKDKILSIIDKQKFIKINQESDACQTSVSTTILNNKKLNGLKKKILEHFNNYVCKELKYTKNKFKITTSWITKAPQHTKSLFHNHNNSLFSGVVYVKTNEKASISFRNYENKRMELIPEEYNLHNSNDFILDSKDNTIMLFPSDIYHRIDMNKSTETRISIAFNFVPTGEIGDIKSDNHWKIS